MARKQVPLRLDPAIYDAIARWAGERTVSVNAQIEMMLRDELRKAGRLPKSAGQIPRRGRPPKRGSPTDGAEGAGGEPDTRGEPDADGGGGAAPHPGA